MVPTTKPPNICIFPGTWVFNQSINIYIYTCTYIIYQLTHSFAFRFTGVALCPQRPKTPEPCRWGTEAFFRHLGVAFETARSGRHTKSHEAAKGTDTMQCNVCMAKNTVVLDGDLLPLDCQYLLVCFPWCQMKEAWDSFAISTTIVQEVPWFRCEVSPFVLHAEIPNFFVLLEAMVPCLYNITNCMCFLIFLNLWRSSQI